MERILKITILAVEREINSSNRNRMLGSMRGRKDKLERKNSVMKLRGDSH